MVAPLRRLVLLVITGLMTLANGLEIDLVSDKGYQWQASLANGSLVVPGRVPGGIYSDLDRFGVLNQGPLFFRYNDLEYRWVSKEDWTYQLRFQVDERVLDHRGVFLVFHGIDTAANISLNGESIGTANDMFIRYRFDVKDSLIVGENILRVDLRSSVRYAEEKFQEQLADYLVPPRCQSDVFQGECHANHIRKMQAAFSWDWGPAFPSVGIWKRVTLEAYDSLTVRDVVVATEPLDAHWNVSLAIFAETADTGTEHTGTWTVEILDKNGTVLAETTRDDKLVGDDAREARLGLQLNVDRSAVEKWMPNGYGRPALYRLRLTYEESGQLSVNEKWIGFRTVQLVEDDLPEGGRTFYFKVNDEPVYLKGSNWIPAHVLPELVTVDYTRELLTAARLANMNSMRVWGGGIYETDEFYDMADEMGILIWQDFMYACSMYPVNAEFLDVVRVETRQQVRRLQSHPSILLWAGNNENEAALRGNWYGTILNFQKYREDYIQLYVNTIRPVVLEEDRTRSFVVSSPSNGKRSEEEGYIAANPYSNLYGDIHHYNYYINAWNWTSYPQPRMASEYGFQSLPSLHAWAEISNPIGQDDDWFYNGTLLDKRQHHPVGNLELKLQVNNRLGDPVTTSPEQHFIDMMYLTQMHQAQAIKTQTEHYRRFRYLTGTDGSGKTMGALYWQLNDIWQGPSWASIEFGGRWKPLHYFAVKFFSPLAIFTVQLEEGPIASFIHYDRQEDMLPGTFHVRVFTWDRLEPVYEESVPVSTNTPPGFPVWSTSLDELFSKTGCARETCVITTSYTNGEEKLAPDNEYLLASFPDVQNLQKANVQISAVSQVYASEESQWTVNVTLTTDYLAPFVWLDTVTDMQGRFSDNGFLFSGPVKTVRFFSKEKLDDSHQLAMDLTVTHLAQIIR